MERSWNIIDSQTKEALESDSFIDVDYQTLKQILGRETLCTEETVVFAAAIRWAKAECGRHGRDTSPQQCREVLGEALYLLRFPTMTRGDFADGAGKSGLLNVLETNDIFFYFAAKDKPKVPFPTIKRKGCNTHLSHVRCCRRFQNVNQFISWGYHLGSCDSIQFSVNRSIYVIGFGLYGSKGIRTTYSVTIELKDGGFLLRKKCQMISCDGSDNIFPVHFNSPVRIATNTFYTASLNVKNTQFGYAGENGMSCVSSGGINFTFKDSPGCTTYGTGVNRGQNPEILYHL